jgi:hypothetical protein
MERMYRNEDMNELTNMLLNDTQIKSLNEFKRNVVEKSSIKGVIITPRGTTIIGSNDSLIRKIDTQIKQREDQIKAFFKWKHKQ